MTQPSTPWLDEIVPDPEKQRVLDAEALLDHAWLRAKEVALPHIGMTPDSSLAAIIIVVADGDNKVTARWGHEAHFASRTITPFDPFGEEDPTETNQPTRPSHPITDEDPRPPDDMRGVYDNM